MLYSRHCMILFLLGIMLVFVFPINAQDTTPYPPITAENVHRLTEINHLGRGTVADVAWSPDGQMLAVGGGAGVWLYSPDYEVTTLLEGQVSDVVWLSDNRHLLTVNFRTLTLWDVEDQSITITSEIEGSAPRDIAISPDGTQIAVASARTIRLLDLNSLELLHQLEGHSGSVNGVVWLSPTELLSGDSHGNLAHWNADTSISLTNQELTTGIETLRLSPTSSLLAIGFTNGEIRIVDSSASDLVLSSEPTADLLTELAWSPDGTHLAVARSSGIIEIWNIQTVQRDALIEVFTEAGLAFQFDIAWTTDSERLVVATEVEVALFDAETGFYVRLVDQFSIGSFDVNWSPDSTYLEATWAAPAPNDNIAVWDVDNSEMVALVEHGWEGMWLADNRSFIYLDQVARPLVFKVWQMDGETTPLVSDITEMSRVVVSPDGTYYAGWDESGMLQIQNIVDGSNVTIEHGQVPISAAWSPSNTYFLTVGGGRIQLWETTTGNLLQTLATFSSSDFAFSPDESLLAISNGEDQFEVWDVATGELLNTITTPYQFRSFEWSPQGDLVLVSHVNGMSFWSTETWEEVFAFETSGRARWSPDGTMIAASGTDGIIRIWAIPES